MSPLTIGLAIEFLGNALLAVSILLVHHKIEEEHKIDRAVLRTMRKEQWLAFLGLVLMTIGFALELWALHVV